MEIERYPFITYEASFPAVQKKELANSDTIMTKGTLTAHGVSKEVQIPIVLIKRDKQLVLAGQFKVKPVDDYKVRATSGIRYRFLNNIKVQINAVLIEY
jgi:polyisoprenoid-binding protein YceI